MEVTVNVQAFEELKRVLSGIPYGDFNITNWRSCACGHATRDPWFQSQGFTSCYSFIDAAAFFGISRREAIRVFHGHRLHGPNAVIQRIDALLSAYQAEVAKQELEQHKNRQAIIDDLLAKANRAAQRMRKVATALIAALF